MTEGTSIFDPASPQADSIRTVAVLALAVSLFIFLVVEGVLVYCLVRFRRRGADPDSEPPQVYGSQPIEVAWTAAPALIVFILVLVGARSLWEIDVPFPEPKAGDEALFVTVVGRQWWWEYQYESYDGRALGFAAANELHVPASEPGRARPVYLRLLSADVCHSFWVPRLAGKIDLIPGRTNRLWFQTEKTGLFLGQCAEYCGAQHANMLLRVVVQPADEFEAWLAHQQTPAAESSADPAAREAFLSQSCVNCHRVRGTPARGDYAPDLTHLMSRRTLAAGMLPNTRENLDRWVRDPQSVKPGCLMPPFGLGRQDQDRIVDYLSTLR